MSTPRISVRNLRKTFHPERGQDVKAVDDISLDVAPGEFLVILGPSGSGKTTLLRCIAGLERADEGEIAVDGRRVYSSRDNVWVAPERRGISMVFQSYALWPHMTVFENVAYPLQTKGVPKPEVAERVQRALDMVGCGALGHRHPAQLSGGQQQRVALARAIVLDSPVVLFDEPLSSVDARVRDELRRELGSLQEKLGFSAVYITHDQTEATVLGHRVAVLSDGRIAQVAPPRELYSRPTSRYVAEFMGAANQYAGVVQDSGSGRARVNMEFGEIQAAQVGSDARAGQPVTIIFRPEHVKLSTEPRGDSTNAWPCIVEQQHFLGYCTEYQLRIGEASVLARSMEGALLDPGTKAWASVSPSSVRLVPVEPAASE